MINAIMTVILALLGVGVAGLVVFAARELFKTVREDAGKTDPKSTKACMEWVNLQRANETAGGRITDEQWDEWHLQDRVAQYWKYPRANYADVEAAKNVAGTLAWLKENDPSAMRARIAELERELGIK